MPLPSVSRRQLLRAFTVSAAGLVSSSALRAAGLAATTDTALRALEQRAGGRLGVYALDSGSGRELAWRADQRFALCSTFKLPLAAAVLREADAGRVALHEVLHYGPQDMVFHAPVTQRHLREGGMRVDALAEAAQVTSDNVAANLLIRRLGGPGAVTALFRQLGDPVTRIDRYEPEMNRVLVGETQDTSTPHAMARTALRLLTSDLLTPVSRDRLRGWTIATRTGLRRLRAGLPTSWLTGDKTGTGASPSMPNRHNDVAVTWPPGRHAIAIAAYYEAPGHFESTRAEDDAVLADVGRVVAAWADGG